MTSNPDLEKQHLREQFEEHMIKKDKQREQQEKIATKNLEEVVVDRIRKRARAEGWDVRRGERGIDLELQKNNNRIVVIEAKGERATPAPVKGRVARVLGQIVMDMNNEEAGKEYVYCVAFPDTQAFRRCKIPTRPRQQLKLNVVYVDCCSGLLKVLLPNGRDMGDAIDLNSFDELFLSSMILRRDVSTQPT